MRRNSLVALVLMLLLLLVGCASPSRQPDVENFLAKYGWSPAGEAEETTIEIPAVFVLESGSAPWPALLDFSRSVGLDFSDQAGRTVKILHVPVEDREGRVSSEYRWQAHLLVSEEGRVVGAWVTAADARGLGYSIEAKDLESITGKSWSEYLEEHSVEASVPPEPESPTLSSAAFATPERG